MPDAAYPSVGRGAQIIEHSGFEFAVRQQIRYVALLVALCMAANVLGHGAWRFLAVDCQHALHQA